MKFYSSHFQHTVLIITFLLTIFISGCSKNLNHNLDDKKLIKIVAELLVAEKMNVPEASRQALLKKIFDEYKTSPQELINSRIQTNRDVIKWISIYSSAREEISAMESNKNPEKVPEIKEEF